MANYKEIIITWVSGNNSAPQNEGKLAVYQIYCDSHIYGRNVLAYIGRTKRTVEERFAEHEESFFKYAQNVSYSVGYINSENLDDLEIAEVILIANHKPFYNQKNIHDMPSKAKEEKVIVINNGQHGMLKTCCTNFWWVKS